jgi:hypothetical protein
MNDQKEVNINKRKSNNQKTLYKSKYFRIAINHFYATSDLSVSTTSSYFKYNRHEFNQNLKNSPHTIQIQLVNIDKRFFYGFINYVHKYENFKCSAFTFFIYLISNIRKLIFKRKSKTISKHSLTKGNSDVLTIEINFKFLTQSLQLLYSNLSSYNKNDILADLSYIRYVKSFKIIGLNLIENDVIIRAWYIYSLLILSFLLNLMIILYRNGLGAH